MRKRVNARRIKLRVRRWTAVLLTAVMLLSCAACSDEYDEEYDDDYKYDDYDYDDSYYDDYDDYDDYADYDDYDSNYSGDTEIPEGDVESIQGVSMSVNNASGDMSLERKQIETASRSDDGVWTIFVYLCGTDLETDSGMGTDDLEEMAKASPSDKVRFVVQTGGTEEWTEDDVDTDKTDRFLIQNGEITKVDEKKLTNMGTPDTLADFLVWGTSNYSSEHMGLVLWNHGGGSITGVCFDEKYDQDSITLMEMNAALLKASETSKRKFDFIGYDACLMGTVEVANVLATYADYMFGSEEMEPGSGWDYTAIGNFLSKNPDSDTEALGKVVCDSFYESNVKADDEELTTLAVIDLSKIDNLILSFNSFAKNMYDAGEDASNLADMIRGIEEVDNFGGNNKTEGYTNMVDMGGICDACSAYADGADKVKQALDAAIVYQVTGSTHPDVSGLSMYYPLSIQGSNELSLFSKVSVSPYYVSFVDRLGKTVATSESFDDYTPDQWFEDDEWEYGELSDDNYWDYLDDYEQTGESPYITFDEEPAVDENGTLGFKLDENGIDNAADIYALVYELSDDGEDIIEIGETIDIQGDWDTGRFYDNFDGYWLSLPDGQNLATYIADSTDDYVVYTSPILLNGEETNLRMRQYYEDGRVEIEGAWDGINEAGAASRDIIKIESGDKITPVYYAYDLDTFDELAYEGAEYEVRGTLEINYEYLAVGEYYYAFNIDDIYGDYYISDVAIFNIDEDGNITF